MSNRKENDFLNGVPELLILRLLDNKAMYGYELVQAIREDSQGVLTFGEGCIYPILHRLEADGLVLGKRDKVNGRSRVVYHLTESGRSRLSVSTTHWERLSQSIAKMLQGGSNGSPALA